MAAFDSIRVSRELKLRSEGYEWWPYDEDEYPWRRKGDADNSGENQWNKIKEIVSCQVFRIQVLKKVFHAVEDLEQRDEDRPEKVKKAVLQTFKSVLEEISDANSKKSYLRAILHYDFVESIAAPPKAKKTDAYQTQLLQNKIQENAELVEAAAQKFSSDATVKNTKFWLMSRLQNVWNELDEVFQRKKLMDAALSSHDSKFQSEFMRAFTVRMRDDDWMKKRKWCEKDTTVKRGAEGFPENDEGLKNFLDGPDGLFQQDNSTARRSCEHELHFCGVGGFFYDDEASWPQTKNSMNIIEYMTHGAPEIFSTPLAQAIVALHWSDIHFLFNAERVVDVLTLTALGGMAFSLHHKTVPQQYLMFFVLGSSIWSLFKVVATLLASCWVYGSPRPAASTWNSIIGALDIYCFAMLATIVFYDFDNAGNMFSIWPGQEGDLRADLYKSSWVCAHPLCLFFVIAARWIYFLLMIVNMKDIGMHILPVWEAVKSEASLMFLLYLLLGCVGLTSAYVCLPVADTPTAIESFMRVFRAFWLADFDFFELEGYDGTMDMDPKLGRKFWKNVTGVDGGSKLPLDDDGHFSIGTMGDGDKDPMISNGIRIFIVATVFLGTVMFMNVYIALLGNTYDAITDNIHARFTKYRLNSIKTLLLRKQFWRIVLPVQGGLIVPASELLRSQCWSIVSRQESLRESLLSVEKAALTTKPCWIRMPATAEQEPDDPAAASKEQVTALEAQLTALEATNKEQVKTLEVKIDQMMGMIKKLAD